MTKRNWRAIRGAVCPALFPTGAGFRLVDDAPLVCALRRALGTLTFEDTQAPLHIVTTDFNSGERVVLSRGLLPTRFGPGLPFRLCGNPGASETGCASTGA